VVPAYFLFECAEQALETIALEYRRILRAPHGQKRDQRRPRRSSGAMMPADRFPAFWEWMGRAD